MATNFHSTTVQKAALEQECEEKRQQILTMEEDVMTLSQLKELQVKQRKKNWVRKSRQNRC